METVEDRPSTPKQEGEPPCHTTSDALHATPACSRSVKGERRRRNYRR